MDVFDAIGGLIHAARLTAACALIRGVRDNSDIALLGKTLAVQSCGLLLDASVRVRDGNRGIFLR